MPRGPSLLPLNQVTLAKASACAPAACLGAERTFIVLADAPLPELKDLESVDGGFDHHSYAGQTDNVRVFFTVVVTCGYERLILCSFGEIDLSQVDNGAALTHTDG
jgi:hypothetical protein